MTQEPQGSIPLMIASLDETTVTLEFEFLSHYDAIQFYDRINEMARNGSFALGLMVNPTKPP